MHCGRYQDRPLTRRDMLRRCANGFGAVALAALLAETYGSARADAPGSPHYRARAKNVIFLYMDGGPSQVDTFDPKPRLDREHGQPIKMKVRADAVQQRRQRAAVARGSSASTARAASRSATCSRTSPSCVDDLAVVRSMVVELLRAHQRQLLPAHRPRPAGPAEHGRVGHLRPGQRVPGPARLRRPQRRPDPARRPRLLQQRLPAGRVPGLGLPARRRARSPTSQPQRGDATSCSAASSTCCASSTRASLGRARRPTTSSKSAIANYELAFRMQTAVPELMDLAQRDRRRRSSCTASTTTRRRRSSAASA